jgi:hypothetical protein
MMIWKDCDFADAAIAAQAIESAVTRALQRDRTLSHLQNGLPTCSKPRAQAVFGQHGRNTSWKGIHFEEYAASTVDGKPRRPEVH